MVIGKIIDSDTITTSGTESSWLRIATNATKLHISVTKGSQTTVYTRKFLMREADAANADNYLNSMGVSPNPNANASFRDEGSPAHFNAFHRNPSASDGLSWNVAHRTAGPLVPLQASSFGWPFPR